jgi:hypothetical protein
MAWPQHGFPAFSIFFFLTNIVNGRPGKHNQEKKRIQLVEKKWAARLCIMLSLRFRFPLLCLCFLLFFLCSVSSTVPFFFWTE